LTCAKAGVEQDADRFCRSVARHLREIGQKLVQMFRDQLLALVEDW
jgi:hypothetical protein